jgi:hypothetical protein
MFSSYFWKRDGYKLWLIGIIMVFFFNLKWAVFLAIGSAAYLLSLKLLEWWRDSRIKTSEDDFL